MLHLLQQIVLELLLRIRNGGIFPPLKGSKSFSQFYWTAYFINVTMNLCWINTAAGFQRVPRGIIRLVAINLAALRREKHWRWLAYYIIIAITPSARRRALVGLALAFSIAILELTNENWLRF